LPSSFAMISSIRILKSCTTVLRRARLLRTWPRPGRLPCRPCRRPAEHSMRSVIAWSAISLIQRMPIISGTGGSGDQVDHEERAYRSEGTGELRSAHQSLPDGVSADGDTGDRHQIELMRAQHRKTGYRNVPFDAWPGARDYYAVLDGVCLQGKCAAVHPVLRQLPWYQNVGQVTKLYFDDIVKI